MTNKIDTNLDDSKLNNEIESKDKKSNKIDNDLIDFDLSEIKDVVNNKLDVPEKDLKNNSKKNKI